MDYWSEQRLDRFAFVADILRRLDQRGWPNRADIGWSDYDVEIYDRRWSKLQLATVTEDQAHGKQLLRCRLRGLWALRAKVALGSLAGLELLVLGFAGRRQPWLWLLLLTLPLFAWFLYRQQRTLQSLAAVLLDEVAKDWKLSKLARAEKAAPEPGRIQAPVGAEANRHGTASSIRKSHGPAEISPAAVLEERAGERRPLPPVSGQEAAGFSREKNRVS
jgi:hypothetical protein